LELALESTLAQVNWMGEDLLAYGRVLSISEQIENLEAVQPDDLVEISRLLFRQSQMAVAAVGTVPEDQAVLDVLGLQ
jgi:predicted Zn-dependent peptidase